MRRLLICPKCEVDSKTQIYKWVGKGFGVEVRRIPFILGEVTEKGDLKIKRAYKGFTIIKGNSYTAYCARCGSPAFKKEVQNGTIQSLNYAWKQMTSGTIKKGGTVGNT